MPESCLTNPNNHGGMMLDLSKKDVKFLSKSIGLAILLPILAIGSCAYFIDWKGPYEDLPSAQQAHIEECASARYALGPAVYDRRADCLDVLPQRTAAKSAETR